MCSHTVPSPMYAYTASNLKRDAFERLVSAEHFPLPVCCSGCPVLTSRPCK